MSVQFDRTTILQTDIVTAFDLSLDVEVHLTSFENSEESIVGGVGSGGMKLGDIVTWRARHFGIWWTMTSTITEYDRPRRFVDEQRSGPFKRFRHIHEFDDLGDGTTRLVDHVEFEAPLGPLGRIAERLVLARYMPHLIDTRNRTLQEMVADTE